MILDMVEDSYDLVVEKLPRATRDRLGWSTEAFISRERLQPAAQPPGKSRYTVACVGVAGASTSRQRKNCIAVGRLPSWRFTPYRSVASTRSRWAVVGALRPAAPPTR